MMMMKNVHYSRDYTHTHILQWVCFMKGSDIVENELR